ncbi:HCNGP-like protein-domain-containing protein [Gorgonomyces haynaldii]|nr:HCNGP-like protein-domain-containing protein [Gorgonomyces haynaldii]
MDLDYKSDSDESSQEDVQQMIEDPSVQQTEQSSQQQPEQQSERTEEQSEPVSVDNSEQLKIENTTNIEKDHLSDALAAFEAEIEQLPTETFQGLTDPKLVQVRQLLVKRGYLPQQPKRNRYIADGLPDPNLESKLNKWMDLKKQGLHLVERLEGTHAFRNPSIISKMVEYTGLTEYGTNYSKYHYDPNRFPDNVYYEALEKEQSTIRTQKPTSNPYLSHKGKFHVEKARKESKQFLSAKFQPARSRPSKRI